MTATDRRAHRGAMTAPVRCPRCPAELRAPGLMSSDWSCSTHGSVSPYAQLGLDALPQVVAHSRVPVWAPLPLPPGWTLTGLASAGDERTGATAVVTALSGPSPVGGPADLLLIAEEPGTGLGCRFAGLDELDPGASVQGAPDAKITVAGHLTALWRCGSLTDRVAFVGEAAGVWLWVLFWPPAAELVLLDAVELHDLRHESHVGLDLPRGAATGLLP